MDHEPPLPIESSLFGVIRQIGEIGQALQLVTNENLALRRDLELLTLEYDLLKKEYDENLLLLQESRSNNINNDLFLPEGMSNTSNDTFSSQSPIIAHSDQKFIEVNPSVEPLYNTIYHDLQSSHRGRLMKKDTRILLRERCDDLDHKLKQQVEKNDLNIKNLTNRLTAQIRLNQQLNNTTISSEQLRADQPDRPSQVVTEHFVEVTKITSSKKKKKRRTIAIEHHRYLILSSKHRKLKIDMAQAIIDLPSERNIIVSYPIKGKHEIILLSFEGEDRTKLWYSRLSVAITSTAPRSGPITPREEVKNKQYGSDTSSDWGEPDLVRTSLSETNLSTGSTVETRVIDTSRHRSDSWLKVTRTRRGGGVTNNTRSLSNVDRLPSAATIQEGIKNNLIKENSEGTPKITSEQQWRTTSPRDLLSEESEQRRKANSTPNLHLTARFQSHSQGELETIT